MKSLVIAIAAVVGLAMTMGGDIAWARGHGGGGGGGGGYRGGGGGYSGGGGYRGGYQGSYRGGYQGGYRGGYYGRYYGGGYGGIYYGGPWYWGWPWYYAGAYPYYSYPYSIYESAPTIYVESASPAPPTLWYYCTDPAGYYPYVQSCNVPWMSVVPPPSAPSDQPGK